MTQQGVNLGEAGANGSCLPLAAAETAARKSFSSLWSCSSSSLYPVPPPISGHARSLHSSCTAILFPPDVSKTQAQLITTIDAISICILPRLLHPSTDSNPLSPVRDVGFNSLNGYLSAEVFLHISRMCQMSSVQWIVRSYVRTHVSRPKKISPTGIYLPSLAMAVMHRERKRCTRTRSGSTLMVTTRIPRAWHGNASCGRHWPGPFIMLGSDAGDAQEQWLLCMGCAYISKPANVDLSGTRAEGCHNGSPTSFPWC